ncbi:MAG: Ig-like domain-containing protein [Longimicrobiales bacterium]
MQPPGGELDQRSPQIIATTPEPLAVITDLAQPVTFQFDERISEQGVRESVLVSPVTAEVEVSKGGRSIHVEVDGGWKPDQVYRVVLLAGVRDLFGNERREPASLVFSTGPPVPNTAIAGLAYDRLTGRPATDVIVEATRKPDTVPYSTAGDTSAFFALTHLPIGDYDVIAYVDQNRNRRRDAPESASPAYPASLVADNDTVVIDLSIVPSDTTPPILTAAQARDSVEVLLTFEDHLDPEASLDAVEVALFALPDTTPVPGVPRLVRPDVFEEERRARLDSLLADSARADTAAVDTAEAPPRRLPITPLAPPQAFEPETGPLPVRELVLVAARPLEHEAMYLVRIGEVTNVSGITGAAGEIDFQVPARPPPAPPDTTGVRSDTTRR